MKTKDLFMMSLTALSLTACSDPRPQSADLVILYTTDVHGACLPFDFKHNAPARTSLANVHTYVSQERQANPDAVLLFDTGDYLQGQPSIYYYNFIDTVTPHLVARVANFMHYDAMGVGNHDIEAGEPVYAHRLKEQFDMPMLCANAIDTRTGTPMFQPYAVFTRQGIKVAVLGLITPNIHAWLPKSLWPHLEFEDMVESAARWVPLIMEREQPDVLVGLFHAGGDPTVGGNTLDTPMNENGSLPVAVKVPGFDVILIGHDHEQRQMDVVNVAGDTVRILDARNHASLVGRVDIHLERAGDGYQKTVTTSLVDMQSYAADSLFAQEYAATIDSVNAYVDRTLGYLASPLSGRDALYGPSAFIDFIHEAQLWATGADISFAAALSPYDYIPVGDITMRQLFTIYRYENQLFTLRLTGEEVLRYLEYGYGMQFNRMQSPADHLIAFRYDDEGNIMQSKSGALLKTPTFNYTSAAGIRYQVDVRKPEGSRVTILSMSDGAPFDMHKDYVVAINSYQASGGGGFIPTGLGWDDAMLRSRTLDTTPKDVRQYIAEYIRVLKIVHPRVRGDWEVVPASWWSQGKAKSAQLLTPAHR